MKKILFILTVIAGLLMSSNAEARRIRIPVSNDIPKVATLPDSSYYKTDEGTHLDLGYIEKDGKRTLVLFSESKPDTYYDISDEYAEAIREDLNVEELSSLIPEPTFWDKWGGSLLFYGFAALIVIGILSYLKDFILGLLGMVKKEKDNNEKKEN